MKKTLFSGLTVTFALLAIMNISVVEKTEAFTFQNSSALTLGYDESMGEKLVYI